MMLPEIIQFSPSDEYHYFFGFHDVPAWNYTGNKLAILRIQNITVPPTPNSPCEVGYLIHKRFKSIALTSAYNYPQGARQQWIGQSENLIYNTCFKNQWRAIVHDTTTHKQVSVLRSSCHTVSHNGWVYGLDYARLHRVGGYGYTGLPDLTASVNAPTTSGITKENINTHEIHLLISVNEVANFQLNERLGKHHYITHALLSPNQRRLAFLHRFKLKDGGETTRLMTIGVDGQGLRCLSTGFLSHFDWIDDDHILIWGRIGSTIERLRQSFFYQIMPPSLTAQAKKYAKRFLKSPSTTSTVSTMNWLKVADQEETIPQPFATSILQEDGHPMFCPTNRDWMICDTYPDKKGIRQLYLFQISTHFKIELGRYKMLNQQPNMEQSVKALIDVEPAVIKAFEIPKMAFFRSGLHCDLHPRWNQTGEWVSFDSIHEGKRAVYGFDVTGVIR